MRYRHDPEGLRLPVKIDATSNGEFAPIPLAPEHHHAHRLAHEAATANARRTGLDRRSFLVSAAGVASTLLAFSLPPERSAWSADQSVSSGEAGRTTRQASSGTPMAARAGA